MKTKAQAMENLKSFMEHKQAGAKTKEEVLEAVTRGRKVSLE